MDRSTFEADGFALVEDVVEEELLVAVRASTETVAETKRRGGVRNPLETVEGARAIATSDGVVEIASALIGPHARVVRAILFDKTPGSNWHLGWHQDVTIAVEQRVETPGFGPWSAKAGVIHVQPPADVLERMVTVRVHIDDCSAINGPLQIVPGSHKHGFMTDADIQTMAQEIRPVTCTGKAGSAVVMKPLLLHASGRAEGNLHRRILHLEFAANDLAGRLSWTSV